MQWMEGDISVTDEVMLERMTWEEVRERMNESDIAIVPVGSTEQHGPHLPVNNDTFTALEFSRRAAEMAYGRVKTVVAPALPYGLTPYTHPGTITLSRETLVSVYRDIARSLIQRGFNKVVFVNGHGGNIAPLRMAIDQVRGETGALIALVHYWELGYERIVELIQTESKTFGHACEMETSISWALGQDVRESRRARSIPPSTPDLQDYVVPIFRPRVSIDIGILDPGVRDMLLSAEWNGVIGDATLASKEKGEEMLRPAIDSFVDFLTRIRDLKLDVRR
jgi:creatinine amidohydrolase